MSFIVFFFVINAQIICGHLNLIGHLKIAPVFFVSIIYPTYKSLYFSSNCDKVLNFRMSSVFFIFLFFHYNANVQVTAPSSVTNVFQVRTEWIDEHKLTVSKRN